MMLVDSHVHLDAPEFHDDLEEVLCRAEKEDVGAILTIGCLNEDLEAATRLLRLVESRPYLYAAFGVHPHDARLFDERIAETLRQLMEHPKVIGWGEVGLDFHYLNSPCDVQERTFREQIRLAKSVKKPLIVHTRDAEQQTIRILEAEFNEGAENVGIMHCFSGSLELAKRTISLGFYISFGGILTFRNADDLRKVAAQLPEDRLLIETDSPYLAPVPRRGRRNEPAYVKLVAEQLAGLRGKQTQEVIRVTGNNFQRLFQLKQVVLQ